ncbi:hypothetical protein, partial [Mesorhizobium sp. M0491]|uniref:hypothetical protein n=1 Tax=Mesorhizobium sp. M0491 TaxID=2956950 RepID=UPI0033390E3C
RAQEARSTPSRMTSFMIAHFAELDAHNQAGHERAISSLCQDASGPLRTVSADGRRSTVENDRNRFTIE